MGDLNFALRSEVDEMQERLTDLELKVQRMERTLSGIRSLGQEFWRTEAVAFLLGTGVQSWHYDAREQSPVFMDLSACETDHGSPRRWVGPTGSLGATISINRSGALIFEARLGEASPAVSEALTLEVDGSTVPWIERAASLMRAIVPAAPGQASLRFRLYVANPAALQNGTGRSFAISEIDISPAAGAAMPQRVSLSANQISDGGNMFHGLEYDQHNRPYRWSGPSTRSSCWVLVDRSQPLVLTVCMAAFVDRVRQSPIALEVDGQLLHPEVAEEAEGIMARVPLPPKQDSEPTTVTLVVPMVIQPNESDRRLLGVAFRYLKCEPPSVHRIHPQKPEIVEPQKSFATTLIGLARASLSSASQG